MTGIPIIALLPILVGILIAVQAQFMAQMDRGMGTLESIFVTYGGGGLLISVTLLLLGGGNLRLGAGLPWYVFTSGLFGVVIVGGIGYSAGRLGLIGTFTVIVTTQFIVGALIDHFGLLGSVRSLDFSRGAGIVLLLVGVWMILR